MKVTGFRVLLLAAIAIALPRQALAHPHMFFSSTAQFLLDDKGRLSGLRTVFLVDELNTLYTFTELGVNADGDQTLTPEEKQKIAETVVEGFGHYGFFAKLRNRFGQIDLPKPHDVSVNLQSSRLGLSFTFDLPRSFPLRNEQLSLQLYDPTYFTAISVDIPPTLVGAPHKCEVTVTKPTETEQSRESEMLLSQLSREETPEEEDIGIIFAEKTTVSCPQ